MIRAISALLCFLLPLAQAIPYNQVTGEVIAHTWLEVGFVSVDDSSWKTVTTKNKEWENNVSVFISLPDIGGSLHTEGTPLASKLRNIMQVEGGDNDLAYQFDIKLAQPNDSACSKEWYVPQFLTEPVQISWLVVEEGVFNLTDNWFVIGSGEITRNNSDASATPNNENAVRFWYPTGCDLSDITKSCEHPGDSLGAVTQLQTNVNKADDGGDSWLYIRVRIIFARHVQLVLIPHSSADASIFRITTPEIASFMVFNTPLSIVCLESMVFETATFTGVTSTAISVNYQNTYDYAPGLFGSISTVSLTDATSLRQFENTGTGGNFITQEDQCVDEQTVHTTAETAYTITVGEVSGSASDFVCKVRFNSATDTNAPTSAPSATPSVSPTPAPSAAPTTKPTAAPTVSPTPIQTPAPTGTCTAAELEVTFTKATR